MSSAEKRFQSFIRKLDNSDYVYDVLRMGPSPIVSVVFGAKPRSGHSKVFEHVGKKQLPQLYVYAIFSKDGEEVHFQTSPLVRVPQNQRSQALSVCNAANNQQRWIKFNLNSSNYIVGHYDLLLQGHGASDACVTIAQRVADVVDETLPLLQSCLGQDASEGEVA